MLSFSVADLLRSAPGTSERYDVTASNLPLAEGIVLAAPVHGRLRLTNSGRGILVQGHLDAVLVQQCSRCLRPAPASIGIDLEEEVLPSVDVESGLPLDDEDEPEALRLSDHHELDLVSAIGDAISLAEPIAPLCRPDCPGLCESCGADLTSEPDHSHPDADVDPRLTTLAGLRERLP